MAAFQGAATPLDVKRAMREAWPAWTTAAAASPMPDIVVVGVATHLIKSSNDSEEALASFNLLSSLSKFCRKYAMNITSQLSLIGAVIV